MTRFGCLQKPSEDGIVSGVDSSDVSDIVAASSFGLEGVVRIGNMIQLRELTQRSRRFHQAEAD